jgi:hypothetical protein
MRTSGLAGLAVAAAAILGGAIPAAAAPTILGPTGFIVTPDCNVVRHGVASVGYHYLNPGTLGPNPSSLGKTNVGIGDHFEVGGTFVGTSGPSGPSGVWGNAKASLYAPDNWIQLAGGVLDVNNATQRAAYVTTLVNGYWLLRHAKFPVKGLKAGAGYGTGGALNAMWVHGSFQMGTPVEVLTEWLSYHNGGGSQLNAGLRLRLGGRPLRGVSLDLLGLDVTGPSRTWSAGFAYKHRFHRRNQSNSTDPKAGGGDD